MTLSSLFTAGLLLFSTPALATESTDGLAEDSSNKQSIVEVELKVIHGTRSHSNIDPRIKDLMPHLKNYRFTGFKLLKSESAKIPDNEMKHFEISRGKSVTVRVLSHDARKARLEVEVHGAKRRKLLDTRLVVNRSGTFIVAGPKYDQGILFLPLSVQWK
jgi:hypothetical protein